MQKRKTTFFPTLAALMAAFLFFLCQTAYEAGAAQPDPDALGSITVAMKDNQQRPVGGGTVTLFAFAELSEKEGGLAWTYTKDFQTCGLSLEKFSTDSFAASLEKYCADKGIKGTEAEIPASGTLVYNDLPAGLYLIVQTKAASGYYPIKPFVVSVPFQEDSGQWVYQVNALPKMELCPTTAKPTPTPKPSNPPKLPQTGQLNWPIPILAGAGILLFLVGWDLVFLRRKDHHAP